MLELCRCLYMCDFLFCFAIKLFRNCHKHLLAYVLTPDEREPFKFGLPHSMFPPTINKTDIYASIKSIYQCMNCCLIDKSNDSKVKYDLSHIAQLYVYSLKPTNKGIQNYEVLRSHHKVWILSFLSKIKGMEWLY